MGPLHCGVKWLEMVSIDLTFNDHAKVLRPLTFKNSEFPCGIEPQIFGFRTPMLYHWATETPW